jgi:hypothetical protein
LYLNDLVDVRDMDLKWIFVVPLEEFDGLRVPTLRPGSSRAMPWQEGKALLEIAPQGATLG